VVRRLAVLAVLVLALAACGGSSEPKSKPLKVPVGVGKGTNTPYAITIAPGGAVRTAGNPPAKAYPLTAEQDAKLSDRVRKAFGKLKSKECAGGFSGQSPQFITALGRTVMVRGGCDSHFNNLWNFLTNSVGIFQVGGF
jgi:hypothetical protein